MAEGRSGIGTFGRLRLCAATLPSALAAALLLSKHELPIADSSATFVHLDAVPAVGGVHADDGADLFTLLLSRPAPES